MAVEDFTVAEAAVELRMSKQQVLNRIVRKRFKGAYKRGWFWMLPHAEVVRHKNSIKKARKSSEQVRKWSNEPIYYVYLHTLPNGQVMWIGRSFDPDRVMQVIKGRHNHQYDLMLEKYGAENIQVQVVKRNLPKEDAFLLERQLIDDYRKAGHPLANYKRITAK